MSSISHTAFAVREYSKVLPMSFTQEGFWFLDQLEVGSTVGTTTNIISTIVEVNKALSVDVLESSLEQLIQHHSILRTTFHFHEGHLIQAISPDKGIALVARDLRKLSQEQQSSQIQQLMAQ